MNETLERVMRVLRLRQAALRVTTSKLERGLEAARFSPDSRLRDMFVYHPAHTGRFSSRGMQLHNLPRGIGVDWEKLLADMTLETVDAEAARLTVAARAKNPGAPEITTDDVLASMIRLTLIPKPEHSFLIADYAQVELRCAGWMAEDAQLLADLAGDPYVLMARRLYGDPTIGKSDPRRQIGKIVVLGCVGQGSPVLTESGFKPIEKVLDSDRLWNGERWVRHSGVIFKGLKQCLIYNGVQFTKDHEILTDAGFIPAGLLARYTPRSLSGKLLGDGRFCTASGGLREGISGLSAAAFAEQFAKLAYGILEEACREDVTNAPTNSPVSVSPMPPPSRPISESDCLIASRLLCLDVITRRTRNMTTTVAEVFTSIRSGERAEVSFYNIFLPYLAMTIRHLRSTGETITVPMYLETYVSVQDEISVSIPVEAAYTYDILDAEEGNRFQVGGMIVHNCGYGLSHNKLALFCQRQRVDLEATGISAEEAVKGFRNTYPGIPRLWRRLDNIARLCVERGYSAEAAKCRFDRMDGALRVTLPSGRQLWYRHARIEMMIPQYAALLGRSVSPKPTVVYEGPRGTRSLYGGKILENIDQAACSDLLRDALIRSEAEGLNPVAHVHDEVVCEVPTDRADAQRNVLVGIVEAGPSWSSGFPIKAECGIAMRYAK